MGEHGNKWSFFCCCCFHLFIFVYFFKALVVTNMSSMAPRMDVGGTSRSPSGGCFSYRSIVLQHQGTAGQAVPAGIPRQRARFPAGDVRKPLCVFC